MSELEQQKGHPITNPDHPAVIEEAQRVINMFNEVQPAGEASIPAVSQQEADGGVDIKHHEKDLAAFDGAAPAQVIGSETPINPLLHRKSVSTNPVTNILKSWGYTLWEEAGDFIGDLPGGDSSKRGAYNRTEKEFLLRQEEKIKEINQRKHANVENITNTDIKEAA